MGILDMVPLLVHGTDQMSQNIFSNQNFMLLHDVMLQNKASSTSFI
jgi:hypothetical protein